MSSDNLTDRQQQVIAQLPASKDDIASNLGVSPSTVKGHIRAIRDKGISVVYDDEANTYYLHNEEKARRVSTKATQSKTREANQFATEQEKVILRRLKRKEPCVASQDPCPSNEDFVLHLTDAHMGDVVEDEYGNEIYNPEICQRSIEHVTQKALDLKERMETMAEFDTCHLLWGGDMLTNENIYDGQAFDIRLMLADQMSYAVNALTQQAKSLSEAFDTVQIVAQPGNHGKTRASGVSKQANMDLILYRWVHDRLIEAGVDNINFIESEAQFHRNFEMRDGKWRGHLRHGHQSLKHVDATSSSESKWRGWHAENRFDIAYRGHYHVSRKEDVMGEYPVIESPSMKPGDDYASKVGQPDLKERQKLATIHGVSDTRPLTWSYVIDDIELDK